MQLMAVGAQDVYLTGNSQMAYRKENFTNKTLKHAAIFACVVSLAILYFYMKRNIILLLLVTIGVIFVSS
jgi:predicted RND superfamily exporter protein